MILGLLLLELIQNDATLLIAKKLVLSMPKNQKLFINNKKQKSLNLDQVNY